MCFRRRSMKVVNLEAVQGFTAPEIMLFHADDLTFLDWILSSSSARIVMTFIYHRAVDTKVSMVSFPSHRLISDTQAIDHLFRCFLWYNLPPSFFPNIPGARPRELLSCSVFFLCFSRQLTRRNPIKFG